MWSSFKFYVNVLLMCIACILPIAIFKLDEESISGAAALAVFFAGGGLLNSLCSLYFESYQDDWDSNHEIIMPIMTIVFTLIAIGLQILVLTLYKDSSSFGLFNLLLDFSGDTGEFYLRLLSIIFSGLALYPIYTMAIGEIDTSEYLWLRKTYYNGQVVKEEYVTHSCDSSKVGFFFTTVLVACCGIMCSSLSVMLFLLCLNIGQLLNGPKRKITLFIGIILGILATIFGIINAYNLGDANFGASINIACELLPIVFAILTTLFLIAYFKIEWISNPIFLIIAVFVMVFVGWVASYFLSELILGLIALF